MRFLLAFILHFSFLVAVLLPIGCAHDTALSHGRNTALDSVDLVRMTDDMAMKIVASPAVQEAIRREGKLRVVVEPVENKMTGEVLPSGAANAFTGRLRVLLSEHARESFTWIMNRQGFNELRRRELKIDPGPSLDAIQPNYALTATFSSVTDESSKARRAYYLCAYELTDLQHRNVLWSGKYEVKKSAVKEFLD